MAIESFARKEIREFYETGRAPKREGWTASASTVARKLDMIAYSGELRDLRSPPGNRLEALKGRWRGFYSIRINDQWRVIFRWSDRGAIDVDLVDYH